MTTAQKRVKAAEEKLQKFNERKIRIKTLTEAGYSVTDIAKTVGVSEGFVRRVLKEEENANS